MRTKKPHMPKVAAVKPKLPHLPKLSGKKKGKGGMNMAKSDY